MERRHGMSRDAIREITDAATAVDSAKRSMDGNAVALAKEDLRATVVLANDYGTSWQTIGDALGIRRGSAYQRFRRRSVPDARERG